MKVTETEVAQCLNNMLPPTNNEQEGTNNLLVLMNCKNRNLHRYDKKSNTQNKHDTNMQLNLSLEVSYTL